MNNDLSCDFAGDVTVAGTLNASNIANLPPIGDIQFRYVGQNNGNFTNLAHSSNGTVITKDNSGMVALGNQALTSTGSVPLFEGNDVAVGFRAMKDYIGINSVAIGTDALATSNATASSSAQDNVAVGHEAMKNIATANGNVCVGSGSGSQILTNGNNVCIGTNADVATGVTDSIAIGSNSVAQTNNECRLNNINKFVSPNTALGSSSEVFTSLNGMGINTTMYVQYASTNVPITSATSGFQNLLPSNNFPKAKGTLTVPAGQLNVGTVMKFKLAGLYEAKKDDEVRFRVTANNNVIYTSPALLCGEDAKDSSNNATPMNLTLEIVFKGVITGVIPPPIATIHGSWDYAKEDGKKVAGSELLSGLSSSTFNYNADNTFMVQMEFTSSDATQTYNNQTTTVEFCQAPP
jgi:hypothetical protein